MSNKLTTKKQGAMSEVQIESLELSEREVSEALTRIGGARLTQKSLKALAAAGYTMRGVMGYRTLQGELLTGRDKLHHVMETIAKKCTEDVELDSLVSAASAISTLHRSITESVKVAKDIIHAQTPGAHDGGSAPVINQSFPATTIIGGQHVHASPVTSVAVPEKPLAAG